MCVIALVSARPHTTGGTGDGWTNTGTGGEWTNTGTGPMTGTGTGWTNTGTGTGPAGRRM